MYPSLIGDNETIKASSYTANNSFSRNSFQNISLEDTLALEWDDDLSGQAAY